MTRRKLTTMPILCLSPAFVSSIDSSITKFINGSKPRSTPVTDLPPFNFTTIQQFIKSTHIYVAHKLCSLFENNLLGVYKQEHERRQRPVTTRPETARPYPLRLAVHVINNNYFKMNYIIRNDSYYLINMYVL